jgi:RNA processing factor Prp31
MQYKEIEGLKPSLYKRLTGVKKEGFAQMLDSVSQYKQSRRKHISRGVAAKLSYADKILLLLMYYREYRTKFHIVTYGISESRVLCNHKRDRKYFNTR